MVTDADEGLGYDADHDDPAQYCVHGNWVGSWWGPDYLCGYCEDGVSVAGARYIEAQRRWRHAKAQIKHLKAWYRFTVELWDEPKMRQNGQDVRWVILGVAIEEMYKNWATIKFWTHRALAEMAELQRLDPDGAIKAELEALYG